MNTQDRILLGYVRELWRYPVKSMQGERLNAAQVTASGVECDRRWAVSDQETGKIASAKHPRRWGMLLRCMAHLDDPTGEVRITLPSGQQITPGQDDVDAALSILTGRMVHLVDHVPEQAEIERYWPDVDGLILRDTVTANVIGQGAPAGTFFDYASLHVLTTATLGMLASFSPASQIVSQRFRPNLVIETPTAVQGFAENDWVGDTIYIGSDIQLRVSNPAPRCVVPTLPQGQLPEDIGILRTIAQRNRPPVPDLDGARLPCLGVYTSVLRGGMIRSGDPVHLGGATASEQ